MTNQTPESVIAEVIEYHADTIGSHWDGCYKHHAVCLAVKLRDMLREPGVPDSPRCAVRELIEEARGFWGSETRVYTEGLVSRLADALEAATRVPVQGEPNDGATQDRIAEIACTALGHRQGGDECMTDYAIADAILAEFTVLSRATVPDAATEIARSLAMASTITGADAEAIAGASMKLAALGEIAELHALCDDRLWSVEKHAERMEAERDAALAALERVRAVCVEAEATKNRNRAWTKRLGYASTSTHDPVPGLKEVLAALDVAPEPEWEYGVTFEPYVTGDGATPSSYNGCETEEGARETGRRLAGPVEAFRVWKRPMRPDIQLVPAGPWLPVEGESE